MTDKISQTQINQYQDLTQASPVLPRQQPILLVTQPDQLMLSNQNLVPVNKKSSIKEKIGSFFKSIARGTEKIANKILGRKEKSGLVSYFDGDPDKAAKFLTSGMKAQTPEELNNLTRTAAASTEENKQFVKDLQEVEKVPDKNEIAKILAGGEDKSISKIENTVDERLKSF
jgi:hypothetical protein